MTESMSYFLKTLLTASMSVKSTFSKGTLFPTMASILRSASVEELRRLSRTTTLYPASITSTVYATRSLATSKKNICFPGGGGVVTVCEPMYPVPPVRRTYLPFLAADDILQFSAETELAAQSWGIESPRVTYPTRQQSLQKILGLCPE